MAQIEVTPGQPDLNVAKMIECINAAKLANCDLIILPELCVPGYLIGDQWEELAYIQDCVSYDEDIKKASIGINVIYGTVALGDGKHKDGRRKLYNVLRFIPADGIMSANWRTNEYIKTLLPNYREFEEPRHFTSAVEAGLTKDPDFYFRPVEICGVKMAFTICEDGWDEDYDVKPLAEYAKRGAELIINISCSPYTAGKNIARDRVFGQGHAKGNGVPLIYVNSVGIQNNGKTVYTFDGSSVAYNRQGEVVIQEPMFEESLYYVQYKDGDLISMSTDKVAFLDDIRILPKGIEETVAAMKYGAKKFLELCGTNKVVIGASGGIDSAVVASLMAQVVGPENLLLVNMPSRYNSATTRGLATELAKNIGCYYISIPIEESVDLTKKQVDGLEILRLPNESNVWELRAMTTSVIRTLKLTPFHLENVQARDRSSRILAAVAAAWGGVFTCNGNKAEFTVGYTTFYGDLGGFFAPVGDLWKHQVYEVGRCLNETERFIPEGTFTVMPSAELSTDQDVDQGKGDPFAYWYHDRLFESWQQIWFRVTPEENLRWYLDGTINEKLYGPEWKDANITGSWYDIYKLFPTVKEFCDDLERWYKLFKGLSVAKRVQAPPILGLTRRAYGFDYRDYLGKAYFTRTYLKMKEEAINAGK